MLPRRAPARTLVDKDPEWRATAIFTREEVETLISHPEIPLDRRIVYALELLAGVRTGEAAALRWRHYDPTKQPLGELLVAFSYSTLRSCEKTTKTDSSKHIPVHPTLAAMLAEWKLGGWAAMMGRRPEPDDLIVPMPPEHAARRRTRTGEAFRGHDYSGERWRRDDLPALGWRHRRHYDMRATFITLALEDGADQHIIETRVTHTRKRRSAFDGYNRGLQWERTCAEVAKLRISRRAVGRGEVIALPVAAGAEGAAAADSDAYRYSGRYSARNGGESHAKIFVNARRPGESASFESGAEARGGPPASCRERSEADRMRGSPVVRAERSPRPRSGRVFEGGDARGRARGVADRKRPRAPRRASPSEHRRPRSTGQNTAPLGRRPGDAGEPDSAVWRTKAPLGLASGLRFIETPSTEDSEAS